MDGHYIPLYTGLHGLAVNEKLLKEKNLPIPETWKDLGDPKYKGLIAMPNPNTSGTGYLLMTTVVQLYGEDPAFDRLPDSRELVSQYLLLYSMSGEPGWTNPRSFCTPTCSNRWNR